MVPASGMSRTGNIQNMASLQMDGPHALNNPEVDRQVTKKSPGNYALAWKTEDGRFVPKYVGRSDTDLNGRLKRHVGEYDLFKFSYASSPKAAFQEECRNYHDFQDQLDNENHPDRPDGSNWECPICEIFDN